MTFTPIGPGQTQAYSVAKYLRKRYTEWTADELKEGQKYREPYLRWTDAAARDSYWMLCDLWKLPREA